MKALECLNNVKLIDMKLKNNIEELESLRKLSAKMSPLLEGGSESGIGEIQETVSSAFTIRESIERINKEIDVCMKYKKDVKTIICENCDSDCCTLLYLRYFLYKTYCEIAEAMNFSYKWVKGGIEKRAFEQFQKGMERQKMK